MSVCPGCLANEPGSLATWSAHTASYLLWESGVRNLPRPSFTLPHKAWIQSQEELQESSVLQDYLNTICWKVIVEFLPDDAKNKLQKNQTEQCVSLHSPGADHSDTHSVLFLLFLPRSSGRIQAKQSKLRKETNQMINQHFPTSGIYCIIGYSSERRLHIRCCSGNKSYGCHLRGKKPLQWAWIKIILLVCACGGCLFVCENSVEKRRRGALWFHKEAGSIGMHHPLMGCPDVCLLVTSGPKAFSHLWSFELKLLRCTTVSFETQKLSGWDVFDELQRMVTIGSFRRRNKKHREFHSSVKSSELSFWVRFRFRFTQWILRKKKFISSLFQRGLYLLWMESNTCSVIFEYHTGVVFVWWQGERGGRRSSQWDRRRQETAWEQSKGDTRWVFT